MEFKVEIFQQSECECVLTRGKSGGETRQDNKVNLVLNNYIKK